MKPGDIIEDCGNKYIYIKEESADSSYDIFECMANVGRGWERTRQIPKDWISVGCGLYYFLHKGERIVIGTINSSYEIY